MLVNGYCSVFVLVFIYVPKQCKMEPIDGQEPNKKINFQTSIYGSCVVRDVQVIPMLMYILIIYIYTIWYAWNSINKIMLFHMIYAEKRSHPCSTAVFLGLCFDDAHWTGRCSRYETSSSPHGSHCLRSPRADHSWEAPVTFPFRSRGWDWCPYYWGLVSHQQSPNISWRWFISPIFSRVMWNIRT